MSYEEKIQIEETRENRMRKFLSSVGENSKQQNCVAKK